MPRNVSPNALSFFALFDLWHLITSKGAPPAETLFEPACDRLAGATFPAGIRLFFFISVSVRKRKIFLSFARKNERAKPRHSRSRSFCRAELVGVCSAEENHMDSLLLSRLLPPSSSLRRMKPSYSSLHRPSTPTHLLPPSTVSSSKCVIERSLRLPPAAAMTGALTSNSTPVGYFL